MASLQNEQIDQSYQGLIKTANNLGGGPFPPAKLQYGDGQELPISIGDGTSVGIGDIVTLQSGTRVIDLNSGNLALTGLTYVDALAGTTNISNGTYEFGLGFPGAPATNVDFTNATVTGLPSGSAGLENGTGTDSLQSAASLTTNPADASGNGSIAIGDGASATRQESIAIGQGAEANGSGSEGSIAIGHGSVASANRGIAIGMNGTTNSSEGIVIGDDVDISGSDRSIAIGGAINISGGNDKVAIGTSASVTGQRGLAFGQNASATANESVAIGYNVTAANAETVSVKALETQTDSTPTAGGIIMSDAGGTDRRINIDASGKLYIDSTAVSGGGAAPMVSLPRTTGNSSSGCDVIYSSVLIPANTFAAGDILQLSGAMSASSSANTIWSAYWISTNGTVGGGATEEVNMGQLALSDADWAVGFQKNLYVNVADGTGAGTELVTGMGYTDVDGVVNTGGIQSYSPDWTSDLYLVNRSCIQATNTGVTYVDHGAVLKKIN